MQNWLNTLRRFFVAKSETENSAQRVIESVLPIASLYGVDVANIDPSGSMTKHHAELRHTRMTYWNELCSRYLNVSAFFVLNPSTC